jgi:hypothetical protein
MRLSTLPFRSDSGCATLTDARKQQRVVSLPATLVFTEFASLIWWPTCRECGAGEGHMDDLIGRLVANAGDRTAAERAVGIIPQSQRRQELLLEVRALAEPRMDATPAANFLNTTGDLMRVAGQPAAAAASARTARTIMRVAHETAGEDAVGGIAGAIPGPGRLV